MFVRQQTEMCYTRDCIHWGASLVILHIDEVIASSWIKQCINEIKWRSAFKNSNMISMFSNIKLVIKESFYYK